MALSALDIKHIRALQQKKYRKETGLFVVEGLKTTMELLNSNLTIKTIYSVDENLVPSSDSYEMILISSRELERISALKSPNKILAIAEIPSISDLNLNSSIILMLDDLNDPGNLGTIIRTARWFGIDQIICSENCADAYDRKVVQSTMGALFHVNLSYRNLNESALELKAAGFELVGATMSGTSLNEYAPAKKTGLIIGSESHGIGPELLQACDAQVTIQNLDSSNKVESLNAAVATSIILHDLTRRLPT